MRRGSLIALILTLGLAQSAGAAEGVAFMKVPQGARGAAMGGAFSMVPANAESFWYNPSAVAGLDGAAVGFSHASWLGDTASEYLFAAYGQGPWGFALNAQYASATDIARDSQGVAGDPFGLLDMAAGAGGGFQIGALRLGLAAKMIRLGVKDATATGFAADAGAQVLLWNGHVSTAVALRNLGSAPEPGQGNSAVHPPMDLRFGVGLLDLNGLNLLGEYRYWPESAQGSAAIGAEYGLQVAAAHLALRAGFESGLAQSGAGLTAGVGAGYGAVSLDYAYQNLEALGSVNRFAVNWQWSGLPQGPASLSERQSAKEAFDAGRFDEAARLYAALLKREPTNAKFENSLGLSLWRSGKQAEAGPHFERSLALNPDQPALRNWLIKMQSTHP